MGNREGCYYGYKGFPTNSMSAVTCLKTDQIAYALSPVCKNESDSIDAIPCAKNEYTQHGGHTGVYQDLLFLCIKK